jgi:sarcosine oxidase
VRSVDVVVIGLGAMGSASLYSIARRGLRVLGVERYEPGHGRSSSFGESRLIRLAYAEGREYVALVREAYDRWEGLERDTGEQVLLRTGMLEAGVPGSPHVRSALLSCANGDLPVTRLTAAAANAQYPAFNLPGDWEVIFQQKAGVLLPEKAIRLFIAAAQAYGAEVRLRTRVLCAEPVGDKVQIVLEGGERIEAGSAVVAAGAWIGDLLPAAAADLKLTRQPLQWFQPREPALVQPDRMPAFIFETSEGLFYGVPDICGTGVKIAWHGSGGDLTSAEETRARVSAAETEHLHAQVRRYVPAAAGPLVKSSVCVYTRAPNDRFVVGLHPTTPQLVIASACSGHGFKFASVMGEILADLAIERKTDPRIKPFARGIAP